MKRKTYESDFKVRVVLESLQRNVTIEQIKRKYQVSASVVNKWRAMFKERVHLVFDGEQTTKKTLPEESPEELKKIIGELTIENALLKKALSVWD